MPFTPNIAIIGIGSPYGLDNIAEPLIHALQNKHSNTSIIIEYLDRPGTYLLEYMKDFHTVYLIDAVRGNQPIGYVYEFVDIAAFACQQQPCSTHGIGLAETLRLGEVLGCLPAKLVIYGVEIGEVCW